MVNVEILEFLYLNKTPIKNRFVYNTDDGKKKRVPKN